MTLELRAVLRADGCPGPAGVAPSACLLPSNTLKRVQLEQEPDLGVHNSGHGQKWVAQSIIKGMKKSTNAANNLWFYRQVEEIKPSLLVVNNMFPLDGNKAVFHFCSNTKPDVNSTLICSFPRKAEGTLSLSRRHSICACEYNTRRICLHRKIGIVLICSRFWSVLWGDFPRTAVEKAWANTSTMLTCAGLT